MNDIEQLARLRDEVPLEPARGAEYAVRAEILRPGLRKPGRMATGRGGSLLTRWGVRPVIAGALAVAVGGGAAIGISVASSPSPVHSTTQSIAWSGRPTADWPASRPAYGRASTEAQLIDYATRAALTERVLKSNEWIVTKLERTNGSQGGEFLFGPPDERKTELYWIRGDGCAYTNFLTFPASLTPATTVTGKLTVTLNPDYIHGSKRNCLPLLSGWKSVSYSYLDSLPTDPTALEKIILSYNPPGGKIPAQEEIFEAINALLADGGQEGVVIPRKLEATFYRILQQLPGVHFESGTDLAGRTGLGFWIVREGYVKEEMVINPVTYQFMGFEDVTIKGDTKTHTKAGQVIAWEALLGTAVVQRPGQLP